MKITKKETPFAPITFEVTIETEEERVAVCTLASYDYTVPRYLSTQDSRFDQRALASFLEKLFTVVVR